MAPRDVQADVGAGPYDVDLLAPLDPVGQTLDLLGLALVREGTNDDDPDARHFWFGDAAGSPGTLVSFLEYPQLDEGKVGRGSTHHLALAVETVEELAAWRDYLRHHGHDCTDVMDRGGFRSLYLRDPDGHILEIASRTH